MSTLIHQARRVPSGARTAGILLASIGLTAAVLTGLSQVVGTWA